MLSFKKDARHSEQSFFPTQAKGRLEWGTRHPAPGKLFGYTTRIMESIHLPRQKTYQIIDPPDFDEWSQQIKNVTDEELLRKEQLANAGLYGDGQGAKSQRWGRYIGSVTEEKRNRGLK